VKKCFGKSEDTFYAAYMGIKVDFLLYPGRLKEFMNHLDWVIPVLFRTATLAKMAVGICGHRDNNI